MKEDISGDETEQEERIQEDEEEEEKETKPNGGHSMGLGHRSFIGENCRVIVLKIPKNTKKGAYQFVLWAKTSTCSQPAISRPFFVKAKKSKIELEFK
jgi:hypothetical protein